MTPAQKRLVEDHLGISKFVARKYARNKDEYDDYAQIGVLGLIAAAERFDSKKGASFASFAFYRVKGVVLDQPRFRVATPRGSSDAMLHLNQDVLIDGEPTNDEDDRRSQLGASHSRPTFEPRAVELMDLRLAVEHLPKRLRFVVEHHEDKSMAEIGVDLHVGQARVSQLYSEALVALRKDLDGRRVVKPPPQSLEPKPPRRVVKPPKKKGRDSQGEQTDGLLDHLIHGGEVISYAKEHHLGKSALNMRLLRLRNHYGARTMVELIAILCRRGQTASLRHASTLEEDEER